MIRLLKIFHFITYHFIEYLLNNHCLPGFAATLVNVGLRNFWNRKRRSSHNNLDNFL